MKIKIKKIKKVGKSLRVNPEIYDKFKKKCKKNKDKITDVQEHLMLLYIGDK